MAKYLFLATVATLWLRPVMLQAQGETTSAIAGSVRDATGAAMAGARVTITNVETGLTRSIATDDAGRFSFPQLRPGAYSVKAAADGFETRQIGSVAA